MHRSPGKRCAACRTAGRRECACAWKATWTALQCTGRYAMNTNCCSSAAHSSSHLRSHTHRGAAKHVSQDRAGPGTSRLAPALVRGRCSSNKVYIHPQQLGPSWCAAKALSWGIGKEVGQVHMDNAEKGPRVSIGLRKGFGWEGVGNVATRAHAHAGPQHQGPIALMFVCSPPAAVPSACPHRPPPWPHPCVPPRQG